MTSWLPYSTDFIFVFFSWVGGGNPPWAVPKSLSLHRVQKIQISKLQIWKNTAGKSALDRVILERMTQESDTRERVTLESENKKNTANVECRSASTSLGCTNVILKVNLWFSNAAKLLTCVLRGWNYDDDDAAEMISSVLDIFCLDSRLLAP